MKKRGRFFVYLGLFLVLSLVMTSCKKKEESKDESLVNEEKEEKSESVSIEVPPVSTEGILYAVILAKEKERLIVQSDGGKTLNLALSKETDLSGLGGEVEEGTAVKIEYEGKLKGASTGGVEVKKILESDKLPKLSKEALSIVGKVILASGDRDMEGLSELCEYPLIIDRGEKIRISDEKAFLSQRKDEIFDRDLTRQISETNPFMLEEYPQGFLLGKSLPNIIVSNTKKGWKISAFHYK